MYLLFNLIKIFKWAVPVVRMEEGRSAFKILIVSPTEKILLVRPSCRWEENIRMDMKEMGINTRNWVDSAKDRGYWGALVNAEINLRVT